MGRAERGEPDVVEELKRLANAGSPLAARMVANSFSGGRDPEAGIDSAAVWLQRAQAF